jgi:hypothetical protein
MPDAAVIQDASDRGSALAPEGEAYQECAVCPHPWAAHDEIGARFCAATSVGHFSRGCACAPTSTPM